MDNVSAIVHLLENDQADFSKVSVNTQEELDSLMSSPEAEYIVVCVMKNRNSGSNHVVLHKRTVLYDNRKVGTFIGASNNRNDILYEYALQNNTLDFYIVNHTKSTTTSLNKAIKSCCSVVQTVGAKVKQVLNIGPLLVSKNNHNQLTKRTIVEAEK